MAKDFFTNRDQQKLLYELQNEILSADEVNLIFPFISKELLNKIQPVFSECLRKQVPIKIITTTFDDKSLFNNLNELAKLIIKYPNIQIHIEDNFEKRSERIHIKASIFKRKESFDSVIIGSSNLTFAGMVSGREWNVKLTGQENKELIIKMSDEFQRLWNENLVNFNNFEEQQALIAKIQQNESQPFELKKKYLYDFQKTVIKKLAYRRFQQKNKHLIIMATGTGKTVVAAFDYQQQLKETKHNLRLLFVAHQKEIVDQALLTFRQVLNDKHFGEVLYAGQDIVNQNQHIFATIQTLNNRLDLFDPNDFDVIIFDEAHHLAAKTFDHVFNYFSPKQVLGLTATPEREDGQDIKEYFDNEYAAEIRIWDAIDQKLLTPFDYYCIDDETDLTGIDLNNEKELFKRVNTNSRNELLYSMIDRYLGIYAHPTALIFCITTEHAKIIANYLKAKNLRAEFLTSENHSDRKRILNDFKNGRINYLCVVNMFNEGIDVPEINTIILLRPTNSKTVYLQQLGRGLRKTDLKSRLEVYDLISNIDNRYDLTLGLKNLLNPDINAKKFLENHEGLPYNSTLFLEKRSEQLILNNLQRWYEDRSRIRRHVFEYYQKYQQNSLTQLLKDYEMNLVTFYDHLNDLFMTSAKNIKTYVKNENDTNRNKNILKQFIFLDNYEVVKYFYDRLTNSLTQDQINWDLDNLLITSCLYEITSREKFYALYPDYLAIPDLIVHFMNHNQLIVEELTMILKYKLENEALKVGQTSLLVECTYTVKQVLSVLNRTNFLHYRREIMILTFQAGYLTFNNSTQLILADEDNLGYGKHTKYDKANQKFYWSIPEEMTLEHKIIKDFKNDQITKHLFIHDRQNYDYKNMFLKLYQYVGLGDFQQMLVDNYLTADFNVLETEE